ncbi:MAG: TVP38/TMEM64 family protein [Alphaproteobacteria bacterium]
MKLGKTLLLIFVVVDVAVALLFLPFRAWLLQFESTVQDLGAVGPAVMVLVYVAATVLLIPGSALTIASGTLFGLPMGFLVAFTGANLGALSAFLLARTQLRARVARWAEGNEKYRSLDRAIGHQGFKIVVLSRLSPAFPFAVLNYLLGLTAVRPGAYVLANLLGMLPGAFLYVYLGVAARDALTGDMHEAAGAYQQVVKYVGLVATAAVVVMVTRLGRKALCAAEQSENAVAMAAGRVATSELAAASVVTPEGGGIDSQR